MKSPFISVFLNKISKVNNNMCFHMFLHEELLFSINNISDKSKYLDEYYKHNTYGKMNHVKLNNVNKLFDDQKSDYFESVFVKTYMYMDYYFEELIGYLKLLNTIDSPKQSKESQFEYLQRILGSKIILDEEIILSIDYMRLRRNRIFHDDGETSKIIKSTYKYKNELLVSYWRHYIEKDYICFKVDELGSFELEELVFFFKIARRTCKYIDGIVMSCVDEFNLYKYEYKRRFTKVNLLPQKILIRKSRKYLEDLLGNKPPETTIIKIINEGI